MFDKYIPVEQDKTRVELKFPEHLFAPKQTNRAVYDLTYREGPVIQQRTLTTWDEKKFPIRNGMAEQRPYAVLPGNISLSDVKKRLLETLLIKRSGRKEEHISDGYT